jgi:hypothetical protein
MTFINPDSPLTDIVIVHIFYINETTPPPIPTQHVGVAKLIRACHMRRRMHALAKLIRRLRRRNSLKRVKHPSTHGEKHGTALACKQSARMQPARRVCSACNQPAMSATHATSPQVQTCMWLTQVDGIHAITEDASNRV